MHIAHDHCATSATPVGVAESHPLRPRPQGSRSAPQALPSWATHSSCDNHSTSARSFARPVCRLFTMRSCLFRKATSIPSIDVISRRLHASSKVTPLIDVRRSIRTGATPIWYTTPVVDKSSTVRSCRGAPKSFKARQTRWAFSSSGLIQRSISPVARTRPCAAMAWAPISIKSACWSDNARNMSK